VLVDDQGIRFVNWSEHRSIVTFDELLYRGAGAPGLTGRTDQTGTGQQGTGQPGTAQNGTAQPGTGQTGTGQQGDDRNGDDRIGARQNGQAEGFRHPWFYRDPATGDEYLLFGASLAEDQATCDEAGAIGIARARGDDLMEWELLPALLDAHCVNGHLERPHIVNENGMYYLLFSTRSDAFTDDVDAPDGLYGFVADELFGDYRPLNESGLVLTNAPDAQLRAYSWMTLQDGKVTSFLRHADGEDDDGLFDGNGPFDDDGDGTAGQRGGRGGTLAPTVVIEFDGDRTRVSDQMLAPGALA
jgi:hypothetical protein